MARGLLTNVVRGEPHPEKLLFMPKYFAIRSSTGRCGGGAGGFPRDNERERRDLLLVVERQSCWELLGDTVATGF